MGNRLIRSFFAMILAWPAPQAVFAQPVSAPDMVETCVPCHGRDGIAREADMPHLAGQNALYLLNQLRAFRSGARKHPEMRYITRHMEPAELEALASYYSALPTR